MYRTLYNHINNQKPYTLYNHININNHKPYSSAILPKARPFALRSRKKKKTKYMCYKIIIIINAINYTLGLYMTCNIFF